MFTSKITSDPLGTASNLIDLAHPHCSMMVVPKIGVPPVIIHVSRNFPNDPARGVPHLWKPSYNYRCSTFHRIFHQLTSIIHGFCWFLDIFSVPNISPKWLVYNPPLKSSLPRGPAFGVFRLKQPRGPAPGEAPELGLRWGPRRLQCGDRGLDNRWAENRWRDSRWTVKP